MAIKRIGTILIIASALLFTSCTGNEAMYTCNETICTSSDAIYTNNEVICTDSETVCTSDEIINSQSIQTFKYENIEYPVFSYIINSETINELVYNYVQQISPDVKTYPVTESNTITFQILEQNSDVISIVFSGKLTSASTSIITLTEIYSCLCIDIVTGTQIKLSDVIKIDDEFVDSYIGKLNDAFHVLYPNEKFMPFGDELYDFEYIKNALLASDQFWSYEAGKEIIPPDITSCLINNNSQVLISLTLPQALGFHVEVKISVDNF